MERTKSIGVSFRSAGLAEAQADGPKEKLAVSLLRWMADADPLPQGLCIYTADLWLACERAPISESLRHSKRAVSI